VTEEFSWKKWEWSAMSNRQEHEQFYAAGFLDLLNNMIPAAYMLYVDSEGRYRYVNDGYLATFKLERDRVIGQKVRDVLGPAVYEKIESYVNQALAGNKVHYETGLNYRGRGNRHLIVDYNPHIDERGAVLGFFALITDITARRESEEKMAWLAAIIESSDDAIVSRDFDGKILTWNRGAVKIFGYTASEMIGKNVDILYLDSDAAQMAELDKKIKTGEKIQSLETKGRTKNGSKVDILLTLSPILDRHHQPVAISAIGADISRLKKTEDELYELNERLELQVADRTSDMKKVMRQLRRLALEITLTEQRERQKFADLLHNDLQQLLVACKLRVERLYMRLSDEKNRDDLLEAVKLLEQSSQTARSISSELRPFVSEHGNLLESIDWLCDWTWKRFDFTIKKQIALDFDPGEVSEEIVVFLLEALRELIFNVVKHAKVNSADLTLSLEAGNLLQITLRDYGPGKEMDGPAESSENLKKGYGLVSISDRLSLLGGSLQTESAVGQGFVVHISVPLDLDRMPGPERGDLFSPQPPTISARKPGKTTSEIRIMIVDDHPTVREGLQSILLEVKDMICVGEADDGEKAVELALNLRPDVIIMDVSMPKLNGIEATRKIMTQMPEICIIGLSVNTEPGTVKSMLRAGAVACLDKGGPNRVLLETIRYCMKQR
jgi:PAS domain S-box-containing protein